VTTEAIGIIHSPFKEKFGVPRQAGLAPHATGEIELFKKFSGQDIVKGLEDFERIWVIFHFHLTPESEYKARMVRPPRLGGNNKMGVFATRSPFRPNSLGLSCFKLGDISHRLGQTFIQISGLDVVEGTPVLDIRPYLPEVDSHPSSRAGWTEGLEQRLDLPVIFSNIANSSLNDLPEKDRLKILIKEYLCLDPRPSYRKDQQVYANRISDFDIKWQILENQIMVLDIQHI